MALEVSNIGVALAGKYDIFLSGLPSWMQTGVNLLLLVLLIFIYAILVWKMHNLIARKNMFGLNLKQYSTSENPIWSKMTSGALYLAEYIVILPFIIFFWFAIFTVFVILLNPEMPTNTILIISAVIVGSIRITAFYKEELSKELSKLLPLNLLVVSIVRSGLGLESIFTQFSQIPNYIIYIPYYLGFIVVMEIFLRTFEVIFALFKKENPYLEQLERLSSKKK